MSPDTMRKALLWWLVAYAAIKFARVFLTAGKGYRDAVPGLRDRLGAGEPALLLVAFTLSVPLAVATDRYAHAKFSRLLDRSVDCFGRLTALSALQPAGEARSGYATYELIRSHRAAALDAGAQLGMTKAAVRAALDRQAATAVSHNAGLKGEDARLAAETERARRLCVTADER